MALGNPVATMMLPILTNNNVSMPKRIIAIGRLSALFGSFGIGNFSTVFISGGDYVAALVAILGWALAWVILYLITGRSLALFPKRKKQKQRNPASVFRSSDAPDLVARPPTLRPRTRQSAPLGLE